MGEPAARKGDGHTCPAHKGGEILEGSPEVRIRGEPAARLLDCAACGGGPADPIAAGSSTVFIGGLPAARMGDATGHGGVITGGEPSVRIGGAAISVAVAGDGAFRERTKSALRALFATPDGRAWLKEMAAAKRRVTIEPAPDGAPTTCAPEAEDGGAPPPGEPADSRIRWNPDEIGPEGPGSPGQRKLAGALSQARAHAAGKGPAPAPVPEEVWDPPPVEVPDLPPSPPGGAGPGQEAPPER